LSLYGDKVKPKTFAARFASPDGYMISYKLPSLRWFNILAQRKKKKKKKRKKERGRRKKDGLIGLIFLFIYFQ
jgi:hypothetical protein